MIVATMTTLMEDMQNQNACENNTQGDDGQRSETETMPLDSAPVGSHMSYKNDSKNSLC
jgi:hypothetical protein